MDALKSSPELLEIVRKTATKNGLLDYEITKVLTNQKGEGFLGQIFMVTLKGDKELDLVLKVAFNSPKLREFIPIRHCYENEVIFYTSLTKVLSNFGKGFDIVPKCLETSLTSTKEVLVLENLRSRGFQLFDKRKVLDDAHVRLIFKIYGEYHAYSMALRDQKPEDYQGFRFHNIFQSMISSDNYKKYLEEQIEEIAECLKPEEEEVMEEFRKYLDGGAAKLMEEVVSAEVDHKALLHGDCHSNNMLFKYKDGKPQEMKLLDFQLCREGSPVCDLSYCLYSGASGEILDDLEEYLRVYHESLSKNLRRLGSDPETLYPFGELKKEWKRFSKFGLLMGIMIVKVKLTEQEDVVDFTDLQIDADRGEKFRSMKFDRELFGERMRALVRHLYKIQAL